jgi:hypothetical protein
MKMPDVQLNGGNLLITLAVILIVLEGLNVVSKGVEAWKKLTGKDAKAKEMADVKDRLNKLEVWQVSVNDRLTQGNHRFDESRKDTIEVLKTLHRIVNHLKSGNDHDKLQQTDDQLFEYLVKKGVSRDELD